MKIARQQLRGHVPDVVSKLKPVGPLAESTPIDVVIALPARNAELRTALLRDIYDPASPRFHQYLSPRQYMETFDPTEASYQSLLDFAKANQLTVVSAAPRKFIRVTAPAAVISNVFNVTLQQYQHPTENRLFYAPDADPAVELETPVSQITGLDSFGLPSRAPNLLKPPGKVSGSPPPAGGSGNGGLFTGGDFRAAYAPGVTLTGSGQAVGILELDGYIDSDIKMYEQKTGIPNVPLQNVYLDGYTGGSPNEESAADIELVISMAPGIAKVIIYGVPYSNAGIVDALNEMANPTKGEPLPYQITTSYYFFYDKNVYDALARLAVQGQALFVASGDFGSYNETSGSGAFPPADHPLVTSVGGTELQTSGPGGAWTSETTASFSGGGYSPWGGDGQFAIPWWQAGMDYTASKGSTTVRNAPDVSIVADNITVFSNGSWNDFAGTSAAAPLWAGFMALANEQAAASGRPRVGFANPALWAIGRGGNCPTCFHDITTGNNFNSTNPNLYSAVAGYDLCTGWGTPNGQDLIDALVGYVASKSWAVNLSTGQGFDAYTWRGAWGSDGPIITGDFNGDGRTDVMMWRDASKSWTVNLSTGQGFDAYEWTGAWGSDGPIITGDFNGDGRTDAMMWRDASKSWTVNLSTGQGFDAYEWTGAWGSDGPIITGDFNGDGRTDAMMWRDASKSWTVNLSTGQGFDAYEWTGAWGSDGPIITGDFNGDGRTDVMMWRDASKSWTVNLSTGQGFDAYEWTGAWGSDGPIITGDFNGDGRTDVMMWRDASKSWTVNLSTGQGFDAYEWTGAWGSDGPIITGDFNGDGRTDVMMWRDASKSWTVNLSTGQGFDAYEWTGAWGSDGPIITGDFNGDGRTDVMMWRE